MKKTVVKYFFGTVLIAVALMWAIGQLLLLSDAVGKKSATHSPAVATTAIDTVTSKDENNTEVNKQRNNAAPYPAEASASLAAYPPLPAVVEGKMTHVATKEEVPELIGVQFVVEHATSTYYIPKGSTVLNLMLQASSSKAVIFTSKEYSGLGTLITSINGKVSNQGRNDLFWIYSVNGKKATVGVSAYVLHDGDVVSWSYEPSTM